MQPSKSSQTGKTTKIGLLYRIRPTLVYKASTAALLTKFIDSDIYQIEHFMAPNWLGKVLGYTEMKGTYHGKDCFWMISGRCVMDDHMRYWLHKVWKEAEENLHRQAFV